MKLTNSLRILAIGSLGMFLAIPQDAADIRHFTLTEAVHLAIAQNRSLKIARLKVVENEEKKASEHSSYFPKITNQSNVLHVTELQNIGIPAGAFGVVGGSLVPAHGVTLPQGQNTFFTSGTQLSQPLTQLIRIHAANRIAAAEVASSRDDLKKAENEVALEVHTLYYGILIARLQKQAADQQTTYAGDNLRESEDDVRNGSALRVAAIQGRAGLLEGQQAVLTAELQLSDLTTELNDLLGLPLDTQLDLDPAVPSSFDQRPREEYVQAAWSENPEIQAAEEAIRKAEAGVAGAKSAYLPNITAYARQSYQDGVPFLVRNFGTFGVNLDWDVFDFGKRRAVVRERGAQLAEAEENVTRLKEEVAVKIERSYNKLERTKHLIQVADQMVKLRQESERLAQNQVTQGEVLVSERREASAETYKAKADYLQASLGYLLAWAELEQAVGRTPSGARLASNYRILPQGPSDEGRTNYDANPSDGQCLVKRYALLNATALGGFFVSCTFLVCYLVYHAQVGSVPFRMKVAIRTVYLGILATHTTLAAPMPALAMLTLRRGLTARPNSHRRLARWILPTWLYVSVTGVVVYLMLYHL